MWNNISHLPKLLGALIAQSSELAQDSTEAGMPIESLSPFDQIRVIVGLFTVVVLGLVIFLVIKAGAHMAKGFSAAANRLPSDSAPQLDDWASKPLERPDVNGESNATVANDPVPNDDQ